jgi:hypothetical protein
MDETPQALPDALQVLAELETVRRKADLLERRVAAWEGELAEVRRVMHALLKARDPQTGDWRAQAAELEHRIARLERRREALAQAPQLSPVVAGRGDPLAADPDAVAIVRARWMPPQAQRGAAVELLATSDGIAPGTPVTFTVRTLASDLPLTEIVGVCDGERLAARWRVPADLPEGELVFEVRHGGAAAQSPALLLPDGR